MNSSLESKPLVVQLAEVSGQPGKYEVTTTVKNVEYRFRWKPRGLIKIPLSELAMLTPEDMDFLAKAPEEVVKALRRARGVEVKLPADPLAALNWESLSRLGVVRRLGPGTIRPLGSRGSPLQIAFLRAKGRARGKRPEWADQVFGRYFDKQAVQFRDFEVGSLADITACLRSGKFDVAHVELPMALVKGKPYLQIGKDDVPTYKVVEQTLAAKPLMAFFHADTDQTGAAMAELRVSSQRARNYGTGCVLHAAPAAEPHSAAFISQTYRDALRSDQKLGRPLGVATGHRIYASIAAPTERTSLLELRPVLESQKAVAAALTSDSKKMGEPELAPASVGSEYGVYMKVFAQSEANQRSKDRLKSERSKQSDDDGPPPKRYPAAKFYHYGYSDRDEVPILETHTVAAPAGRRLEFHFWIDPVKGGINFGDTILKLEEGKVYPFDIRARVWSDQAGFSFREERIVISIPSRGASEHARFVLTEYPKHADVEFFLFLESADGELIGAFMVRAHFRPESVPEKDAQSVHDIFLSSEYFSFQEKPGKSSLTLLLSMRAPGKLQLFTLKPDQKPWANLAITETMLNERNREIYRLCTMIALEAASQEQKARTISAASENFTRLAEKGWVLFQDLFSVQGDLEARAFSKDLLLNLSEGSRITIAMDQGAWQMIVPWGLLYTDSGFREYPYSASLGGFLGHKFNVVVRPAITPGTPPESSHRPVRLAAAWLTRAETAQLEAGLQPAQDAGDLKVDKIKVEKRSLPALGTGEFDLLHFYCHGHTWFPNDFRPAEFVQLLQDHKDRLQKAMPGVGAQAAELAKFLARVADASESLMMMDGGFVYRSDLSDSLATLKGAPVVLLSMCESAQVTPSGAGFVTMFLQRGARAAVGTEGPTLWTLGRDLDLKIIGRLLKGQTIGEAFYESKRELAKQNALALVYSLWGDAGARLPINQPDSSALHKGTIHG